MSTPTSVDQTVQRGQLPHEQAEILALSSSPSSSPSTNQLSCSSSSPHISSNEDSPQEASSLEPSDYSDYDYDFDSSDEEIPTIARSEARYKKIANSVAVEDNDACRSDDESNNMPKGVVLVAVRDTKSDNNVTGEEDKNQTDTPATATKGCQYHYFRSQPDTCFKAGTSWTPGDPLPNRTFANEHIAVAQSDLQGHGVFAAADIKDGTEVLMEAPLLRARGLEKLCARHAKLSDEEKAVYDGLVGYHEWETCPVRQKWSANSFDLAMGQNGVFAIASNFNHACKGQRNTKYDWDQRRGVMTFTATRDIEKGDELLVSYCDYRHVLKAVYGFVCHCGGCEHQAVDLGC